MPEIESDFANGIFSGQNLEHLLPEDLCGFFLASFRILKKSGLLIIEGPDNRPISGDPSPIKSVPFGKYCFAAARSVDAWIPTPRNAKRGSCKQRMSAYTFIGFLAMRRR